MLSGKLKRTPGSVELIYPVALRAESWYNGIA